MHYISTTPPTNGPDPKTYWYTNDNEVEESASDDEQSVQQDVQYWYSNYIDMNLMIMNPDELLLDLHNTTQIVSMFLRQIGSMRQFYGKVA
jgi:hypothetical protein